jgi:hypothetical protein
MGTKHPDVLANPPSPEEGLTLAEMHMRCWRVIASCRKCGLQIHMSLPMLIRLHGPDGILWGRQPPCPATKCDRGRLVYSVQALAGGSWRSMASPAPERIIALWREKRGVRYLGPR